MCVSRVEVFGYMLSFNVPYSISSGESVNKQHYFKDLTSIKRRRTTMVNYLEPIKVQYLDSKHCVLRVIVRVTLVTLTFVI